MKSKRHEIIVWGRKEAAPITRIVDALNRMESQVDLYEIVDGVEDYANAILLVRHSLLKSKEKRRVDALGIVRRRFPDATDVILHKGDEWRGAR